MQELSDIAIIGISGRWPGAETIERLYENLSVGKISIGPVSEERKIETGLPHDQDYKIGGYLPDIDKFDYRFFGLSKAEAENMDPHQRLLLEVAHETFEDAGYSNKSLDKFTVAIYIADTTLDYHTLAGEFHPTLKTGSTKCFVGSHLARQFNLRGNVAMVDTSCSSSLVAVHMACKDLILGECEYALVCGASVDLFSFQDNQFIDELDSPNGVSNPFSSQANGMVYGEAVACVLLTRREAAEKEKDSIYAIIKGSSVNNNGARSPSLTSPDAETLSEVIVSAWEKAGINPSDIGLIEGHGSGTLLGDQIELAGLKMAFDQFSVQANSCGLSTVKKNIGHSRAAAGICGLISATLSIKYGKFFPNHLFQGPNPYFNFSNSPFYIIQEKRDWLVGNGQSRIAGVTSIGLSGVNCHLVLEEYRPHPKQPKNEIQPMCFIPVSSKTQEGLARSIESLTACLTSAKFNLEDVSFTLSLCRNHYQYRAAVCTDGMPDFTQAVFSTTAAPDGKKKSRLFFLIEYFDQANLTVFDQPLLEKFLTRHNKNVAATEPKSAHGNDASTFIESAYNALTYFGITPNDILADDFGKVYARYLNGQMTEGDYRAYAASYKSSGHAEFDSRMERLSSKLRDQQSVILSLSPNGPITSFLQNKQQIEGIDVLVFSQNLYGLLAELYSRGIDFNYEKLFSYNSSIGKVKLPKYKFIKDRCWFKKINPQLLGVAKSPSIIVEGAVTSIEKEIGEIWANHLTLDSLSVNDSFFDIGGDSLKATKIIREINSQFKVAFDFEDMFDYPTIKEFAKLAHQTIPVFDRLIKYWKSALKAETISADSNFFELGGHSLLASDVLSKINRDFNLALNFDDFFLHSTINDQCNLIENRLRRKDSGRLSIPRSSVSTCLATPLQEQLWIASTLDESGDIYSQPEAFVVEGPFDHHALGEAFRLILLRHKILRSIFFFDEDGLKLKSLPYSPSQLANNFFDVSSSRNAREAANEIIRSEVERKFDLTEGPLVRSVLIKVSSQTHYMLLNTHHIIVDGISSQILFNELMSLYISFKQGGYTQLPAIPIQFSDYAVWLSAQLATGLFDNSKRYWLNRLANRSVQELPFAQGNDAGVVDEIGFKQFGVPADICDLISIATHQQKVTTFMLAISAIKVLIFRYTGSRDIIIGTPVSGRVGEDMKNVVGPFVNTLPLRTIIAEEETARSLVSKVKDGVLSDLNNQLFPLSTLSDELNTQTATLFKCVVAFQSYELSSFEGKTDFKLRILETGFRKLRADFRIEFQPTQNGLGFEIDFNRKLIRENEVSIFGDRLIKTLELISTSPDIPIQSISVDDSKHITQNLEFGNLFNNQF